MITLLEEWVLNNLRFTFAFNLFLFFFISKKGSKLKGEKNNKMTKIEPIGVR